MGLEQIVRFSPGRQPAWRDVQELLERNGFPVQLRMIDNELAFPGESPPESWHDLRIATPQGMVTVRRQQDQILVVTWGNANSEMLQAWNAMAWAFAEAGDGRITSSPENLTASAFGIVADLPTCIRSEI